jgi:integral membrane protein (TIGR01906 family)
LDNKLLLTIIRWLIILAMPFFLGLGTIRLIIAWDYPSFEYGRIPPDQFGFTPEQRLELAHGTLDYLQRPEPAEEVIFMLEELRLPGTDLPLYNEREISHMLDVKIVADAMKRIVWITGLIVALGLAFLLLRPETRLFGWRTLMYAGLATVIALAAIALFILIGWNTFFVQFHQLLFPAGTWTFAYSDSLIRLFPEQFWFDIGVLVSVSTLLQGIILALAGYWLSRAG